MTAIDTLRSTVTRLEALWGYMPILILYYPGHRDEYWQLWHPRHRGSHDDMPVYIIESDGVLQLHPDAPSVLLLP